MSLYLKYRPQDFANLIGQDYIRQTILNSIQKGTISHAYLFCGTRGTGKTSTARILAKSINCQNLGETGEPCGVCIICKAINENKLVDLIEIDAASNRGIDEIRELKENIQFAPSQSKKKIYIIDEVHMLTKEAFNALLKTLEEPPEHAYFILATTEVHKIPETIISRCQRFNFRKIKTEDIVDRLKYIADGEGFTFEENALELIAKQANGGLRDAIGLMEQMASEGELKFDFISQNLGLVGEEHVDTFFESLVAKSTAEALEKINKLVESSYNLAEFNREFIEFLRDKMLDQVNSNQSVEEIIKIIEIFSQAGIELKNTVVPQLPLEIAVIKVCEVSEGKISPPKENKEKDKKGFFGFGGDSKPKEKKDESEIKAAEQKQETEAETSIPEEKEQEKDSAVIEIPEFSLDSVKKNWQKIIDGIPTAFVKMSFKASSPIKTTESTLFIGLQSKFHKDKLSDMSNKNEILIALEKIFEQPINLEIQDLEVKLEPTITATKTQKSKEDKAPSLNEIAEEVFTFID